MRRFAWWAALSALVAAPVGAAVPGHGAKAPQDGAVQKVSSKTAEVARLQQDVASEEAKSHDADRRMEEQDRAIADLRHQLEQLKGAQAVPGKGP